MCVVSEFYLKNKSRVSWDSNSFELELPSSSINQFGSYHFVLLPPMMKTLINLIATLSLAFPSISGDLVGVTWDSSSSTFSVGDMLTGDMVAWANFTDKINSTGWSYLAVETNSTYPDDTQAYAAGLAEGYASYNLIYMHWLNTVEGYCNDDIAYCERLKQFMKTNMGWMHEQVTIHQDTDPFWHHISLLLGQLAGLEDGYNRRSSEKGLPDVRALHEGQGFQNLGFIMFQIFGDLEDLEQVLNKTGLMKRTLGTGSCSGLVKVLPGNADLYASQDSWNSYQSMLRILKKYTFNYHRTSAKDSELVAGSSMSFSSYPGLLTSGDDFYVISSGLVTLETTIGNGNPALWQYVKPVGGALEWMRSIIANRLATDGKAWADLFLRYNSGTYNNQWMVVNYNLFVKSAPLKDGLIWVIEQLPKYTAAEDRTDTLRNQSYWPSYNSPYFPLIFNKSGAAAAAEKMGDWFTYDKTPRALIFKRDNGKVHDVSTMIKLMRYNDYTHDPLSRCNCTPPYSAENAISARSDLNPKNGTYAFGALGHRSHGGIDMKMTTSDMRLNLQFVAIGGPTYDSLPPFQWSKADFRDDTPHFGHPDLWKFDPVSYGVEGAQPYDPK